MAKLGIPGRFIIYAGYFLSNRRTTVKVNETKSKHFYLNEGLPQGSAISPLFFLILINYISTNQAPDTLVSLFADDTAIGIHELENSNMQKSTGSMQKEVD